MKSVLIKDLEGKIIHKDYDPLNCTLDNLNYELVITKADNSDSLWINNKEFKRTGNTSETFISDSGVIYSIKLNRLLRKSICDRLYEKVNVNGSHFDTHKIVYSVWNGELEDGLTINHKDANKRNNNYNNLEAITRVENVQHAIEHGIHLHIKSKDKILQDNGL